MTVLTCIDCIDLTLTVSPCVARGAGVAEDSATAQILLPLQSDDLRGHAQCHRGLAGGTGETDHTFTLYPRLVIVSLVDKWLFC